MWVHAAHLKRTGIPYGSTSRLLGTGLGGLGGFGALGSSMSNYYGGNNLTASLLAQSKLHQRMVLFDDAFARNI